MRRLFIFAAVLVSTVAVSGQKFASEAELEAKARAIHSRVIPIDAHVDVLLPGTSDYYYLPGRQSRSDIARLKKGGIGAIALAIAVSGGPRTPESYAAARKEADEKLAAIRALVKENTDSVELAVSPGDVERIRKAGKIAVIESFVNARIIGRELDGIDEFYKHGVRIFALTFGGTNDWADSSRPEGGMFAHGGLSELGRQAVARMNRLGMIVDVSQMSTDALLQTVRLSKAPVIASHSSVRALVDRARNLSDQELDAIEANGGVVHVTVWNGYVAKIPAELPAKVRAIRVKYGLPAEFPGLDFANGESILPKEKIEAFDTELAAVTPKATVKDVVDHIDYIVKRIGIDHVGIGSDFNHGSGVDGFNDESEALNITKELLRRGYSEKQIAKIWGGNFLRVWGDVEKTAKKLRTRPSEN